MGEAQIIHLLLSILIVENYCILKKYKNVIVNITTLMYIVSVPFYCFIPTPYEKFWERFSILTFILIIGLSTYYSIKLTFTKERKKYPLYGVGWGLFLLSYFIVDLSRNDRLSQVLKNFLMMDKISLVLVIIVFALLGLNVYYAIRIWCKRKNSKIEYSKLKNYLCLLRFNFAGILLIFIILFFIKYSK